MKQEVTRHVIVDLDTGEFLQRIDYVTIYYRWTFTHSIHQAKLGHKYLASVLDDTWLYEFDGSWYPDWQYLKLLKLKGWI